MTKFDLSEHNASAWDEESVEESPWCTPVSSETIEKARNGEIELKLTPNKFVPSSWLEGIKGKDVLCLGSGGGQQAPILAAAGANVISYDISQEQLNKDLFVANRDKLKLQTIRGDMSDLSAFEDASCDLIVNAVSDIFVRDIKKVWKECYRVLKPGGELFSGMMNPSFFLFDHADAAESGNLTVKHKLPYSDFSSISEKKRKKMVSNNVPLVFGHSLETLIGGQTNAGFAIIDLYEDWWADEETPLNKFSPTTFVTRAKKPEL
jgi:SAM-dependent methyltransferase